MSVTERAKTIQLAQLWQIVIREKKQYSAQWIERERKSQSLDSEEERKRKRKI